jgi:hypothetical protein
MTSQESMRLAYSWRHHFWGRRGAGAVRIRAFAVAPRIPRLPEIARVF